MAEKTQIKPPDLAAIINKDSNPNEPVEKHYLALPTRDGFTHTCVVPNELGRVTKLKHKHGRVIAETESGHDMIVPTFKDKP